VRSSVIIQTDLFIDFEAQLLRWASQFEYCSVLRSHPKGNYNYPDKIKFDSLVAVDAIDVVKADGQNSFERLRAFQVKHQDWMFGHFSYDLKNEVEKLQSQNEDYIGFEDLSFFIPKHLFICENNQWRYEGDTEILHSILVEIGDQKIESFSSPAVDLKPQINHSEYIKGVLNMKHHIQLGDIYEANFCQDFRAENSCINLVSVYEKLTQHSATPFSAFYRVNDNWLLCASPERFISKKGDRVYSQPIKGTAKRGANVDEDLQLINQLKNDPKEQAENVMIVDLVRNDLSRTAAKGSVQVDELFGIYTFPQVHQMISTISSKLKEESTGIDAIEKAFPMGSMTGAPKVMAMQLIDEFESFKRGLYSGSVGYFEPNGDFDFNVVIRSILYNQKTSRISAPVGGAITIKADPEKEYQESLLKAKAMLNILQNG
tara:strand:+ start:4200 stop:5492 length:1293 start_codon:yes stop_codon:yes gene_type:complete